MKFIVYIRNCSIKGLKGIEMIVLIKISTTSVFRPRYPPGQAFRPLEQRIEDYWHDCG